MQWGYSSVVSKETSVTTNFPIAFNSKCLALIAGTKVDSDYPDIMAQNLSFSATQAVFFLNLFNTVIGNIRVSYIAMGR